jgi:hypothetical protein
MNFFAVSGFRGNESVSLCVGTKKRQTQMFDAIVFDLSVVLGG